MRQGISETWGSACSVRARARQDSSERRDRKGSSRQEQVIVVLIGVPTRHVKFQDDADLRGIHTHALMTTCTHIHTRTHIHAHTHVQIHTHAHTHAHTYIHTNAHMHAYIHTYTHEHAHTRCDTSTHIYTHTYKYMYLQICVIFFVCVCAYVCEHRLCTNANTVCANTCTHKQTHAHTRAHTHTYAHTHTHARTHTHEHTHPLPNLSLTYTLLFVGTTIYTYAYIQTGSTRIPKIDSTARRHCRKSSSSSSTGKRLFTAFIAHDYLNMCIYICISS